MDNYLAQLKFMFVAIRAIEHGYVDIIREENNEFAGVRISSHPELEEVNLIGLVRPIGFVLKYQDRISELEACKIFDFKFQIVKIENGDKKIYEILLVGSKKIINAEVIYRPKPIRIMTIGIKYAMPGWLNVLFYFGVIHFFFMLLFIGWIPIEINVYGFLFSELSIFIFFWVTTISFLYLSWITKIFGVFIFFVSQILIQFLFYNYQFWEPQTLYLMVLPASFLIGKLYYYYTRIPNLNKNLNEIFKSVSLTISQNEITELNGFSEIINQNKHTVVVELNSLSKIGKWIKVGGFIGIVMIFLFLGIDRGSYKSDASFLFGSYLKGAIGGGLGSIIFGGIYYIVQALKNRHKSRM